MNSAFDDAHTYLNNAIRTYVTATKTVDKLFAIKLVVLSMIVAVDKLVEAIGIESDTPFQGNIEESSFFLPMAAYEQRMTELTFLEEKNPSLSELKLPNRLKYHLDILKFVYGQYGLRSLLAVNVKEFINESLFFIIDIQQLVDDLTKDT